MTLRERARYLRNEVWLRVHTDWPVWAVVGASVVSGWFVGKHHGAFHGVVAGTVVLWGLTRVLLTAEASGRREERDRRRR